MKTERRIGELTRELPKAPGGQPYQRRSTGPTAGPVAKSTALAARGITKQEAARFEALD